MRDTPRSGLAHERGAADNIVNIPLPHGSGSEAFRAAVSDIALPALRAFAPDLILISAGFDAIAGDPLGKLRVALEDYRWIGRQLAGVPCGRLVSVLEGGYNLTLLGACAVAYLSGLEDGNE